uniref:Uncharacterized protein n=1 Tax=viral metagenome TaxID=1070528 RepID=A0A6M3LLA6_9ZZZZ
MTVLADREVLLGTVRFPLVSRVLKTETRESQGDKKYWYLLHNLTKGMGKLERKSNADDGFLWWNECDTDHTGHVIPPPPGTAISSYSTWTSPTGVTDAAADWINDAQAYDGNTGTAAQTSVLVAVNTWSEYLVLTIASTNVKAVRVWGVVDLSENPTTDEMDVDVYYGGAWVDVYSGTFQLAQYNIFGLGGTRAVTSVRVRLKNTGTTTNTCSVYEVGLLTATADADAISTLTFAHFDSNLYCGRNTKLYRLDSSSGDAYIEVKSGFAANIQQIISTVTTKLAILLGDADELWYMDATEVFVETDEIGAYRGIDWNGRFNWINSTGSQLSYCTAFAAVLVETDNGSITETVTINGLDVYQDSTGDSCIYARTTIGVWAHDTATPKFYKINVELPSHTSTALAGLSADGYYISQGLQLIKYTTGNYDAAIDTKYGLDALDGVPSEMNAHIVALIRGIGFTYILMDSTKIGTSGYSWVAKRNEITNAWSCLWKESAANKAMHSGIVSDVYARRLWFDSGNVIYYIPVPTTNLFPKLVSGSTFKTGVILISSWFEADSSTLSKLATELISYAMAVTTTETVALDYRTDRTNTDLATGWTTLVTLDTTGEAGRVATAFASSVGAEFKSIQFKVTLACSPNTDAPDLQALDLAYFDNVNVKHAFKFAVSTVEYYKNNSPRQLETAIQTAVDTGTLLAFSYRDGTATSDTYYVRVRRAPGATGTGKDYAGVWTIEAIEP